MSIARSRHVWRLTRDATDRSQRRRVLQLCALGAAALFCSVAIPGLAAAPDAADAKAFIDGLGAQVLAIIKMPNLSQSQRQERFRELFSQNFDVPTIGRFVVGRYWNRASSDEQKAYLDTFRNYVAAIYAEQFSHYQGEGFKTLGSRSIGDGESLVRSQIERHSQPAINVEFRVKGAPGSFKIDDVTVENVSLIITKRDEFSSLLAQSGLKGVTDRMQTVLKNTQQAGT